jgi:hypothetical protein
MSTSLTIEDAVALMVNMDFIPDGESVLSMTAAFLEVAEVEYENASSRDAYQLKVLKNRMEACAARHSLVRLLTKSLMEDAIYTTDSLIECDDASTDKNPLVTIDSLSAWAYDRFGIAIPIKGIVVREGLIATSNTKIPSWEYVTIKLYRNHKITYSLGKNLGWKRSSFLDIGLIDKRTLKPNVLGGILIGLSKGKKYPLNGIVQGSHKKNISELRRSLKKLTGLADDAFLPVNKTDGYKPGFKLIDDRRNADDRAKREAVHVSDNMPYRDDDENDEDLPEAKDYDDCGTSDSESGSKFLKEHDK